MLLRPLHLKKVQRHHKLGPKLKDVVHAVHAELRLCEVVAGPLSRYDDPIWEGGETADITELGALGQVGQQAAEGVEGVGIGKLCKMERGKALNEEEDTVLEEGERQTERGGGERERASHCRQEQQQHNRRVSKWVIVCPVKAT